MSIEQQLNALKVIPVITIENADHAVDLAKVLMENGLPCAEITFRTACAGQAIQNIRQAYPDILIGAGTVLTPAQADEAIAAGANFIVSPGFNPTVVKHCLTQGYLIVPGVNSPSLVEQALELGVKTLKFFPAEPSGGIGMLKALASVYPAKFMPTGGVNVKNINDYLALPNVVACGGTWMIPSQLIADQQWQQLATLVKEAVATVNG